MTAPDTDTLAGLREELRLIGCHQNGDARCTCSIGADAVDAIDALRAQATKDKARIERLEARLAAAEAGEDALVEALVDHSDLLRSAFSIAQREGVNGMVASTNWDAFYNRVAVLLKRHHALVNEARATIILARAEKEDGGG